MRFAASDRIKDVQPAISLGMIGNSDEVFLNGVKIGGEGVLGNWFVEATNVTRLYKVPEGLLRYDTENILAIRIMNTYLQGGILAGKIGIGDYKELLLEKLNRNYFRKIVETSFLAYFCIFLLSCIFLHINGIKDKEYKFFGIFIFLYCITYILDSLIFYETGLKTSFVQMVSYAISVLLPPSLLIFLTSTFKTESNPVVKSVFFFSIILFLSVISFSTYNYTVYSILSTAFVFNIVIVGILGFYISTKAFITRQHEAVPVFIGVIGLCSAVIAEALGGMHIKYYIGLSFSDCITAFFMASIVFAMVMRFARMKNSMMTLSGKILTSHEEERKRIARELHDGLGQNLLAIKFNLQKINRCAKEKLLDSVLDEVTGSINELREISKNLRPAFLDEMGICAVLKMYGERFSQNTGIKVDVTTDNCPRPAGNIEDNLFRIAQEALNNTAKHSGAENVELSLNYISRSLVMEIRDDGKGFDYKTSSNGQHGIGILTMKERTALINGDMMIKSKKGKGTYLRIEVPVR